jgi:predicted transglutaminase-like cysteine proteinase
MSPARLALMGFYAALAFVAWAAFATPVQAQADPRTPVGYLVMCLEYPEECRGGGGIVPMTEELIVMLADVNKAVNQNMVQVADAPGTDTWNPNEWAAGDCEEFVMAKRRVLKFIGVPIEAMMIGVVLLENGEGHAILVVMTDEGTLTLDNLTNDVVPVARTPYRLVMLLP